MTVIGAISRGAQHVNRSKRMGVLFWLALVLVAGVAAAPAVGIVAKSLSHSKWADDLMRGLDPSWIAEVFLDSRGYSAAGVVGPAGLALVLVVLTQILMAGGALTVLTSEDRRFTAGRFFAGCGRYFWRFVRLFLVSLFFYGAILLVNSALRWAADRVWGEGMRATPLHYAGQIRILVVAFLFIVVGMIFDYAKIRLVLKPDRSVLHATRRAIGFVAGHFRLCLAIWLILIVGGILFYLAYDRVAFWAAAAGAGGVVVLILAQQVYILSRIWLRLLFWASQAEYFLGTVVPREPDTAAPPVFEWPAPASDPAVAEQSPLLPSMDEEAAGPA